MGVGMTHYIHRTNGGRYKYTKINNYGTEVEVDGISADRLQDWVKLYKSGYRPNPMELTRDEASALEAYCQRS